jgi:2-dehydropantoate 2-reductase
MRSRHQLPGLRIGVLGTGAAGGYYGGKLAYFGRDLHFLVRSAEGRAVLRRSGSRVRSRVGDLRVAKVQTYAATEEIGACDLMLTAVKATPHRRATLKSLSIAGRARARKLIEEQERAA